MDLTSAESAHVQGDLFAAPASANKIMAVIDALNERYGKATVAAASTLSKLDALRADDACLHNWLESGD